ncbi:hypothetical protein HZ326_14284 [Fusarium oxysporum f. sp. albedinis]|nr:hypothetical protein HZ326_14284 [Fusarium oxysporum f. sp. albedinis]
MMLKGSWHFAYMHNRRHDARRAIGSIPSLLMRTLYRLHSRLLLLHFNAIESAEARYLTLQRVSGSDRAVHRRSDGQRATVLWPQH